MKPILVTSYVDPDLDGVAGAVAYVEFLKKTGAAAAVGIFGEPHDEAKYVLDRFGFEYPPTVADTNGYDEVALVDTSDLNGLAGKVPVEKVVEIIDHRAVNEAGKFPNAKVQIELVGAAATLIAEKFMRAGVGISKESATLLYGAIVSNTLNFKGSVTTDRDRAAAAWLNGVAELPEIFLRDLFIAKSDLTDGKLSSRIQGDFAVFNMGDTKVGIAQIEMIGARNLIAERGGEIAGILDRIREERRLDFAFLNAIDLEEVNGYLFTQDPETQRLLEKVLDVRFLDAMAERSSVLMRKQIVPLLMGELVQ